MSMTSNLGSSVLLTSRLNPVPIAKRCESAQERCGDDCVDQTQMPQWGEEVRGEWVGQTLELSGQ